MTKRLLIQASSSYDGEFQTVPVNSGKFTNVDTAIGRFEVAVFICNFDGCAAHKDNSFYNYGDETNLTVEHPSKGEKHKTMPNLRIIIKFVPSRVIGGSELLFGNDLTTQVRKYVPTSLLSTGLKFFKWFINPTVESDLYCDCPYIYSPALNGFSGLGVVEESESVDSRTETTISGLENLTHFAHPDEIIPKKSKDRLKYFCKTLRCDKFDFEPDKTYICVFDTNFLRMGDSKYHVAIPTFGSKTFDIDVLQYANDDLNNFNWVVKAGGEHGVNEGDLGLVLNFKLIQEE